MEFQESPLPVQTRSNEVVAQVVADHGLSQAWICDATGLDSGFVSRVLQGQYSVPPAILSALWRRTKDQRIAHVALGEFEHILISLPPDAPEWPAIVQNAMGHAATAIASLAEHQAEPPGSGLTHNQSLKARVLDAIRSLVTVIKRIDAHAPRTLDTAA